MSRDDDKVNSDDNSVAVNAVSNSGNDSSTNKPNTQTPNMTNSTSNNWVNNSKIQESAPEIRKNMVSKATEFLVTETVQKMPVDRKVNFLRKKGLTDYEIQTSIQRAARICYDNQSLSKQNAGLSPPPVNYHLSNAPGAIQTSFKSQSWYSRLFGPIAFAAAVVYVGYQLYKKYIEIWLFGNQKSPLESRLEAVELSIQRCIKLLEEKNNSHTASNDVYSDQHKECINVRAELKSIKSLLIKRFQIPSAPASSSLPQWQLSKNTKPQVEQQNKTNNTEILNTSLQTSKSNISNETQKSLVVGFQSNGLIDSDNDKDSMIINSMSNDTSLPTNANQSLIKSKDVADEINSEHKLL